jgi:hypothetical protein
VSLILNNLGTIAMRRGRPDEAEPLLEESLSLSRELGSRRVAVYALAGLGDVALERGDDARAAALHGEALSECVDLGDMEGIATGFEGLARAAAGSGLGRRAMRLAGAAAALRERLKVALPASERRAIEDTLSAVRQALGREAADRALADGRAMALDRAVEIAVTGDE